MRQLDREANKRDAIAKDYLSTYLSVSPISHGLIRAIECRLFSQVDPSAPVLDVGCGDGMFANVLFAGEVGKVDVGIDASVSVLASTRKAVVYKNIVAANALALPFSDGYFATTFSNSVLEHIKHVDVALREIHRVLGHDGRLIFVVPSDLISDYFFYSSSLRQIRLAKVADWYIKKKHQALREYHLYSPEVWTDKLRRAGFSSITYRYFNQRSIVQICDILAPLALVFLYAERRLHRFLPPLGKWRGVLLSRFLRRYYALDSNEIGGSLFIVAHKLTTCASNRRTCQSEI